MQSASVLQPQKFPARTQPPPFGLKLQSESFKQPKHSCFVPSQTGFSGSWQMTLQGGGDAGFEAESAAVHARAASTAAAPRDIHASRVIGSWALLIRKRCSRPARV